MRVVKELFGMSEGREVYSFTLSQEGIEVSVIEYGARVRSILVTTNGKQVPVALGLRSLEDYLQDSYFLGAVCGRNANRIAGASFRINGKNYELEKNEGDNNLHSGSNGFHNRFFSGTEIENGVEFRLESQEYDQGYPGNMQICVRYTLTKENGLRISYRTVSDQNTISNLTSHAYFNLEGTGTILNHELTIRADFYTPVDEDSIPTGEILKVSGTPFDFTGKRRIAQSMEAKEEPVCDGYDHNYVLRCEEEYPVATINAPVSGITMEVYTDLPGIQFYSGNFLLNYVFPNGIGGGKHSGFCLETQYFPDAIHRSHFGQPIIKAGEVFETYTEYRFPRQ